jgi:antirestriction protein
MSHSDCATYGGLAAFGGDREREAAHHKVELNRASQLIKDKFPDIGVRCFFVNFEGVFAACGEGAEQAA